MNINNTTIWNLSSSSADFDTMATQLTPMALRKPVWLALIKAILSPVKSVHADYDTFRRLKRRRLSYNGQVRLLENIINQLMIGSYNMDAPVIYLDEPEPIEEFLISPNGNWMMQNSIFYDSDPVMMQHWDEYNPEQLLQDHPEYYCILYDHTSHVASLGFEVHLTPPLDEDAPSSEVKTKYYTNGGLVALKDIVDAYKLAGKRYVVIQDEG